MTHHQENQIYHENLFTSSSFKSDDLSPTESVVEWIDLLNSDGIKIADVTRSLMRKHHLIHRATYILVHDGEGKILVQKRTATKDFYPNYWDVTAGGVVQVNESLLVSAKREAKEELGIVDIPFIDHGEFFCDVENINVFGRLYSCITKGPFALQAEEVSEVKWETPQEIFAKVEDFTPDSIMALNKWLSRA